MIEPTDLEIAMAICCGEVCRTDTAHCHAIDHFNEAGRVRRLLERAAKPKMAGAEEQLVLL